MNPLPAWLAPERVAQRKRVVEFERQAWLSHEKRELDLIDFKLDGGAQACEAEAKGRFAEVERRGLLEDWGDCDSGSDEVYDWRKVIETVMRDRHGCADDWLVVPDGPGLMGILSLPDPKDDERAIEYVVRGRVELPPGACPDYYEGPASIVWQGTPRVDGSAFVRLLRETNERPSGSPGSGRPHGEGESTPLLGRRLGELPALGLLPAFSPVLEQWVGLVSVAVLFAAAFFVLSLIEDAHRKQREG